jgi:hypothetical protein
LICNNHNCFSLATVVSGITTVATNSRRRTTVRKQAAIAPLALLGRRQGAQVSPVENDDDVETHSLEGQQQQQQHRGQEQSLRYTPVSAHTNASSMPRSMRPSVLKPSDHMRRPLPGGGEGEKEGDDEIEFGEGDRQGGHERAPSSHRNETLGRLEECLSEQQLMESSKKHVRPSKLAPLVTSSPYPLPNPNSFSNSDPAHRSKRNKSVML